MIDKKEHDRIVQGYKNIIDQKELEINELKKQNVDLKKKLKEEKKLSKMLYESPWMSEYDIIFIKKAEVVYCKACKEDPTTEPVEMCNYCALAEIRQSYLDKDKIHEEH